MDEVKDFVQDAAARGIWVMIDQHGCEGCSYFNYPHYSYEAPYNSKGLNYPETEAGGEQAAGDFWTDGNRQSFLKDMWKYVAGQLKNVTGVMGYEIQNEPKQGYLPNTHATTQLMVDVQHDIAAAIRPVDGNHVIVFTTRAGFAPGIRAPQLDLSAWTGLRAQSPSTSTTTSEPGGATGWAGRSRARTTTRSLSSSSTTISFPTKGSPRTSAPPRCKPSS